MSRNENENALLSIYQKTPGQFVENVIRAESVTKLNSMGHQEAIDDVDYERANYVYKLYLLCPI